MAVTAVALSLFFHRWQQYLHCVYGQYTRIRVQVQQVSPFKAWSCIRADQRRCFAVVVFVWLLWVGESSVCKISLKCTKRVFITLQWKQRYVVVLALTKWFPWKYCAKGELATTIRVTVGEHRDTIGYGPGCLTVTKSDPGLYRSELLAWWAEP